jgi:hypothetical protein
MTDRVVRPLGEIAADLAPAVEHGSVLWIVVR